MHPLESGMGVPAFLAKLWRLVEDSDTNDLISWSSDGRSFIIQNQAKFAKELLPLNYKHNNMASFIRQLNMYGFHKITSIDNGGLKFDKDEMEFSHPYFQKGHPYLIEHIKRKIANPKQAETEKTVTKAETVTRVLNEVKNMRGRQDSLDTRFSAMKQENEALWREVAILRQKHLKQQQIVNKLIQFLVTIVQPQRSGLNSGIGKRRGQLMINDAPKSKLRKPSEGPIISELTEELLDEVDSDYDDPPINLTNAQSPGSQTSKDLDGASNSAGSIDGLGLDDVDEIDTNNMEIYSEEPRKKDHLSGFSAAALKKEPVDSDLATGSSGKSLLIPSQNIENTQQEIDADSMLNVLSDPGAGTSSGMSTHNVDQLVAQNTLFDETSQPPHDLLADELFAFDGKTAEQEKAEDLLITKYNPKHAHDIMRLSSVSDYTGHLDNVQNDLDSLKDLLRNDAYQLDTNQLLGLFGSDDLVGYEMSPNLDLFADDKKDGNQTGELMNYQPSPYNNSLDLNELLQNVGDIDSVQND